MIVWSSEFLVCLVINFVLMFFCSGCEIVSNEKGIHFVTGLNGRASGEAFVELASLEDVKKALTKDKHHIGRRYIDGNCFLTWILLHEFVLR